MRLDQALLMDIRSALRAWPIRLYLALQAAAALLLVWRLGQERISTVVLVWLGMLALAFFAWWAGRHRLAHPEPDAVPAARARSFFALIGVAGMLVWPLHIATGVVLFACGVGGWLYASWRSGGFSGTGARLMRSWRPFVPLLLLILVPRLLFGGPAYLVGAALALPSGIGQQLLYLVGLFGPFEAIARSASAAAVAAALIFALVHLPIVLPQHDGDVIAALANLVLFQSAVGLIACLAYRRHRAVLPIGAAHALAIG